MEISHLGESVSLALCSAPDTMESGGGSMSSRDVIHPDDMPFVLAPPPNDPLCHRHVDAVPVRDTLEVFVDGLRAAAGLPAVSAAMFRHRRVVDHAGRAAEYVQRRRVAVGLDSDELCRSVQAALDTGVIGSCGGCGANFSVVAMVELKGGDKICGVCSRLAAGAYDPAPPVRPAPAAANGEARWSGWLPY